MNAKFAKPRMLKWFYKCSYHISLFFRKPRLEKSNLKTNCNLKRTPAGNKYISCKLSRCPHIEVGFYQMVSILVFTSETHHAGHLAPAEDSKALLKAIPHVVTKESRCHTFRSSESSGIQEETWESCKSRDINRNLPINPLIKVLAADTPGKPQRKSPAGIHVLVLQMAAIDSKRLGCK